MSDQQSVIKRLAGYFFNKIFVTIIAVVVITAIASVVIFKNYVNSPIPLNRGVSAFIPRGASTKEIITILTGEDVIASPKLFLIATYIYKNKHFKAGEYFFPTKITPIDIINMLEEGKTTLRRLTIAEGLTTHQVLEIIKNNKSLIGDVPENIKEGELLPETYFFPYGESRSSLIERMRQNQGMVLDELWEKRQKNLPIKSKKEAIILASIVERETSLDQEKGRIAAVFINRLNQGMRLQADPTVIYAITKGQMKLNLALTKNDLTIDSSYNTYKIEGLPPKPISNPGKESISAVLNPPKTEELYFVATGKGGHNFAKTLDQHNKNVKKYRKAIGSKPKSH